MGSEMCIRDSFLGFDDFDGIFLLGLLVPGEEDFAEAALSEFLNHFVLSEAAAGVEVFAVGGV